MPTENEKKQDSREEKDAVGPEPNAQGPYLRYGDLILVEKTKDQ